MKTIQYIRSIIFQISYFLIRIPLYALSLLPLSWLYVLCRGLSRVIFRVFRYRRKVITKNLSTVFPDADHSYHQELEARFMEHFSDMIAESLKAFTMSAEEIRQRFDIRISDEMKSDLSNHQDIFIAGGHVNNWEWAVITSGDQVPARTIAIYKPLSSHAMNQIMLDLRQKGKTLMVPMGLVLRDILTRDRPATAYIFLSDQSTPFTLTAHRVDFFGIRTPFVPGMSAMAARQNIPIYYFTIQKIRRGYYKAHFDLLVRDPANYSPEEITTLYSKKLQENILNQPACWLWTHKRWKRVLEY